MQFRLPFSLLMMLAVICIPSSGQEPSRNRSALPHESVVLQLADYLDTGRTKQAPNQILFDQVSDQRFLAAGWHSFIRGTQANGKVWVSGKVGSFDIHLPATSVLNIRMKLLRYKTKSTMPEQKVHIIWNDHEVSVVNMNADEKEVRFEVQKAQTNIGPNRVQLIPEYWFSPSGLGEGKDKRHLSIGCSGIWIERGQSNTYFEGVTTIEENGSIVQGSGTVATIFLPMPEEPFITLKGTLQAPDGLDKKHVEGVIRVALTSDGKGQIVLLEKNIFESSGELIKDIDVSMSLADYAGKAAGISLSFAANSDTESMRVLLSETKLVWGEARINGQHSVLATDCSTVCEGSTTFSLSSSTRSVRTISSHTGPCR